MNLAVKELIPNDFAADSRVWIYQCNRLLTMGETLEADEQIQQFIQSWNSHGTPVKGFGTIFYGQFIILMADESATGISGCSTDSSVRLIKNLEQQFRVNFFDRHLLAFILKDKVQILPMAHLAHALANDFITGDTLYFNNTVLSKADLENNWIIPLRSSWLKNRIGLAS